MDNKIDLYCPECKKVTQHQIWADDRISFGTYRVWTLSCACGVKYSCQTPFSGLDENVRGKLLEARETCKMFWTPEERDAEEKALGRKKGSNTQINATDYYQLPCGLFLEDFIYCKKLNFNMGSALKYRWRAGFKDGEPTDKDMRKAEHYVKFEAKCRGVDTDIVDAEVNQLREEAYLWRQHEELEGK